MEKLILSIDQKICTGCSRCPDYSKHFFMGDDGNAYVKKTEDQEKPDNPDIKGPDQTVDVDESDNEGVIEAAEICPGECILVELVDVIPVAT